MENRMGLISVAYVYRTPRCSVFILRIQITVCIMVVDDVGSRVNLASYAEVLSSNPFV